MTSQYHQALATVERPGEPLLFSGMPLYVVTGKKADGSIGFIAFEPDWNTALDRAKAAVNTRDGAYVDAYVGDIHTAFHKTR